MQNKRILTIVARISLGTRHGVTNMVYTIQPMRHLHSKIRRLESYMCVAVGSHGQNCGANLPDTYR